MPKQVECPAPVLERLITEYGTSMLRLCLTYLGDLDLAQDAVQEAFLRVYCHWPQDGPDFEKAWIFCITANSCRDMLKSGWKKRVTLVDEYPPIISGEQLPKEAGGLFDAIRGLKPIYREVVLLRYYEQFSIKEISQILGIGQSAVSMRLKRAVKELKKMLCKVPSEEW